MSIENYEIRTTFTADSRQASRAFSIFTRDIKAVNAQLNSAQRESIRLANAQRIQAATTTEATSRLERLAAVLRTGSVAMVGFNGAILSGLFFMIQLRRITTNALSAIFESFREALPQMHAFNQQTNKLSANWEFFKFQLADALTQSPLFNIMIDALANVLNLLGRMPEPLRQILGFGLLIVAALSGFGFVIFSAWLGLSGLVDLMGGFLLKTNNATGAVVAFGDETEKAGNKAKPTILGMNRALLIGIGKWILIALAVFGTIASLNKFADSSDYAREKSENVRESWKTALNSIGRAFSDLTGIAVAEITDLDLTLDTLMVGIGSVISNISNAIAGAIAGISALISFGVAAFKELQILTGHREGRSGEFLSETFDQVSKDFETIMDGFSSPFTAQDEYRKQRWMDEIYGPESEWDSAFADRIKNVEEQGKTFGDLFKTGVETSVDDIGTNISDQITADVETTIQADSSARERFRDTGGTTFNYNDFSGQHIEDAMNMANLSDADRNAFNAGMDMVMGQVGGTRE